jgi:DNA-binding CsgD family transcriptional regulator
LREGRWALARECFAAADTAEAFEGLSWAAWWLDDAETVFSAREHALRLYLDHGRPAAAARMATWIGADQNDFHGASVVAAGSFERARRLLAPLPAGPEHGWLSLHEGYLRHRAGDGTAARAQAVAAADIGRRFGVPDLEMLGLALEGASLVAGAQVAEGMRRLDEATATALEGRAQIPISGAWACCFLVSACLDVYDFERAFAWSDRIAAFADRYGSRWMLAFCRAEYGAIDRWRGRWQQAGALLEAAVEDFSRSRPAWVAGPLTGLAELRRRQRRTPEALALLDRAGATAHLCHAEIALDRGDTATAVDLAERNLRKLAPQRRLDRVPTLDLLVRANIKGQTPYVGRGLVEGWVEELRELAELGGTRPLRAIADRAEGVARSDRRLLEDAVDGFAGAPYETAQARLDLAALLEREGREGAAAREREAAQRTLRELGAGEPPLPELTPREREVVALLAEGLTNREIGERLVVSEHTVHRHVTNILRKLDAPSRAAAVALAARHRAI